jgi:hypothetical protein
LVADATMLFSSYQLPLLKTIPAAALLRAGINAIYIYAIIERPLFKWLQLKVKFNRIFDGR